MVKEQKDNLFLLVKSLSKSEKRQFKLYVGRLDINADAKFLNLFTVLDKQTVYNEVEILKATSIKKVQLANVKTHLYKQILVSLKLSPSHQNIRSQIREQLDFASILYHKGLYRQSLRILEKAKEMAISHEEKNMAYEIVELEKVIESQYITRSMSGRAEELTAQSKALSTDNIIASKLSNLSLQLYSIFLKTGYVKNERESIWIKDYFETRLPKIEKKKLGFREKLWLYKAYLWYSFLTQDFINCFKYASKWVALFDEHPNMIQSHPVFYLKGNNYLMESLFYLKDKQRFEQTLNTLEGITKRNDFPADDNVASLQFLYLNLNRINLFFIDGSFKQGIEIIPKIELDLQKHSDRIDQHHIMTFYYKFASLYFGAGENRKAISYLERIINNKELTMREDLMCFSRVLNLVAHYEAGLDYHLERLLRSTYKFLIKMNDMHEVQREMIYFIRGLQDIYPQDLKKAFIKLHKKLKIYENHPFESRAFLYLDVISWLESKIDNIPVDEVIKAKYLQHK